MLIQFEVTKEFSTYSVSKVLGVEIVLIMECELTKARKKDDSSLPKPKCTLFGEATNTTERPKLTSGQIALLSNTWMLLVENISRVGVVAFMNSGVRFLRWTVCR
ncbi:uncharacterized protein LOC111089448 [Limulus polyphemus]|uniref:Uncharacterized protein LOC111089448 n=1 Tax=Limulus polyphemus TaxID=6850 RepID=A0ABM1TP80_LIMPO|nr:uncharacterized protein LOC111089448 [Limulus polyphemus]